MSMERTVTLDWLNCLSNRRVKLRKISDPVLIEVLFELLIRFQFCTPDCGQKCTKDEKKQIIVKFLKTKIVDYDGNNLFSSEEDLLVACWLFLYHIVWSLEDASLRNHLSLQLENSSQEFIKTFLERMQEQSELTVKTVTKCLNYAADKCSSLQRSPDEYVSRLSSGFTPNMQTPPGIKRKMSLTLREFLMSPNSQKKFIEEHTKELRRLKMELNNELSEKSELMEENSKLKQTMEKLNKQFQVKLNENDKLKHEIEEISANLINSNDSTTKSVTIEEREVADLKIRLSELQFYVTSLEKENESITKQLSSREKSITAMNEEFESLRKRYTDLELTLMNKEEILERVSHDKDFFKSEMNNLKEFNQELTEKIASLECMRLDVVETKAPTLESEMQLQVMKETIDLVNKNIMIIENEHARVISDNHSLNERVKNLLDERKEIDSTMKELNSRIDTLKQENIALKSNKDNLSKRLKQTEAKLTNANRDNETIKTQSEKITQELLQEKEMLESEILMLRQSLNQQAFLCDELHDRQECLLADNERLDSELEKAKSQLSHNETLLEDFNAQMEHVKGENLKLSMKLNELENVNKSINAKLVEASKEKSKLLKNREEMEKKLAKNKDTIESLVKQTSQEQDRSTELSKMVEIHLKKIEQTEISLKKLEEDRLDLNKRINILNEELKLSNSRYQYEADAHSKAQSQVERLEREFGEEKSRNETLANDLKSKTLENKTLICKIKSLNDQLSDVQSQRENLDEKLQSLNEQLTSERDQVQKLQNGNAKMAEKIDQLAKELNETHALYHNEIKIKETLILEVNDLQQIVSNQRNQIDTLISQNDSFMMANQTLDDKLREAEHDLKCDRNQISKYKEEMEFLQNERRTLQDEVSTLQNTLKLAQTKNAELTESVRNIENEKKHLEDAGSALLEESNMLKCSLKQSEYEKESLADKLSDISHQNENLLNERSSLAESLESFKSQIPPLNEQITKLRSRVDELTSINDTFKSNLAELTSQIETTKYEKQTALSKCDSLIEQIQNLQNSNSDMSKTKEQLESENIQRQNTIEALKNDLELASASKSQLEQKLQSLLEESKSLEEQRKTLHEDIAKLKTSNSQLSSSYDELKQQKQRQQEQHESRIMELNDQILMLRDDMKQMKESHLNKLQSIETSLKANQQQKDALQAKYASLLEEKHHLDSNYKTETNQVEILKNKIAELEKSNNDQSTELKILEANCKRSSDENDRLKDQSKNLGNDICEVQERLKASELETETLRNEKKLLLEKIINFENSFKEIQLEKETLSKDFEALATEKDVIIGQNEDLEKRAKDNEVAVESLNCEIDQLKKCIDKLSNENKYYEEQLKSVQTTLDSMKLEKQEFDVTYQKLYEDMITIQKQNKEIRENNAELQLKVVQLEEENDKQKTEITKLETNLSNETDKLTQLARDRDIETSSMKAENQRLCEENTKYAIAVQRLEQLQNERQKLLETLEEKELKLNEITAKWQEELDNMRQERTRDAAKISGLLEDCKNLRNSVTDLEQKLTSAEKLHEELIQSKTKLKDMFLLQIDQILSSNETLKSENTKLAEKNREKAWYLKEMHKYVEPIIRALEEHEKKVLQLEEKNDSLAKDIEECNGNKWTLKTQNEQLTGMIDQLSKDNQHLNDQIQNLTDERDLLNFKNQELKIDNDEIKKDMSRIRKLMRKESSEHDALKESSEALAETVKQMQQRVDNLVAENSKLEKYIEEINIRNETDINRKISEVEKCAGTIKELQNEKEVLLAKMADFNKEHEKLFEERNAMLDQKIIFEQENVKLNRRLDEVTAQKNELYSMSELNNKTFENRIEDLILKNDEQLVTIQNLRGENELLMSEMADVKNTASIASRRQIEKLEKKMDELVATNEELNKKDELLEKEIGSLSEANHRLQVKLEKQTSINKSLEMKLENYGDLISSKDALTRRIEELKSKLEESVEQNERLTEEVNILVDKDTALVKENENLLAKVDELEIRIDTLNDTVTSKNKEIALLQDEYRIFKDEYRKLSEHKSELDKDWKESLLDNFKSASAKCDELKEANLKLSADLADKQQVIVALEAEVQKAKVGEIDMNETRILASGPDNKTLIILKEENQKLTEEVLNLKKKINSDKEMLKQKADKLYTTLTAKIQAEYEKKLERAKADYNKLISQKYSVKTETEWKRKEEEYQKMLRKEKEHIKDLSSQLWNINDKYLNLKQHIESKMSPNDFRRYSVDNIFSPGTLSRRTQSATHLNTMDGRFVKPLDFDRRLSTMSEDIQFQSRSRKPLSMTSGKKFSLSSAKVFPTEDEEMEIFDNACLADLKQGRMNDDSDFNKQRLSVLQARNSLCPPHLKSSYPAETQFLPLQEFKENDIKLGLSCDIENSDIENLLPGDRSKKNRNQTSYKKPGPPTPSKHGGRVSNIGVETPRNILKESNDNTARRKSFTPRLFNLFPTRGHAAVTAPTQRTQDENPSVTPKRNRLSSIRRRFSKNPQELGNTNSGFH